MCYGQLITITLYSTQITYLTTCDSVKKNLYFISAALTDHRGFMITKRGHDTHSAQQGITY